MYILINTYLIPLFEEIAALSLPAKSQNIILA